MKIPSYSYQYPSHRRVQLAAVKEGLFHPRLPSFRRMDMDTAGHKLPDEHCRTTTSCGPGKIYQFSFFFYQDQNGTLTSSKYWLSFLQFIHFVKHWIIKEIYQPLKIRPPWSSEGVKINRLLCRLWNASFVKICSSWHMCRSIHVPWEIYVRLE